MKDCKFCDASRRQERSVLENDLFWADFDIHPVSTGHMKIIAKRHVESFFDLSADEAAAAYDLLKEAKHLLDEKYHPAGYNVGVNVGSVAGQTVFHLHIHLIPRYSGDVADPVGGVRNVIPGKGNYLKK